MGKVANAVFTLACLLPAAAAQAACVTNATDETLFFTIDARTGAGRVAADVAPDADLCLPETTGAVLRVFGSADAEEGCSRSVATNDRDTLRMFHRFDNCLWASQE